MLVADAGRGAVLLDFFVAAPGRGADPRGARAADRRRRLLRRRRAGVPRRRRLVRRLRHAGGDVRGASRATAPCRSPSSSRAGGRARARRRRGQRAAGVHLRDPRADLLEASAEARALFAPAAACRARATCSATPSSADTLERLAAEGAAPFYAGDIARRRSRWVARARRHADARGPRRLRGDPREPVARRATAAARCSPTRRRRPAGS